MANQSKLLTVNIDSKVMKKAAKALVSNVLLRVAGWVVGTAFEAACVSRSLQHTVGAWHAAGPHTTSVGKVRQLLADLWVLAAPRDPLRECGVLAGNDSWWTVFWGLREAGERLACLQLRVALAHEEHEAFTSNLVLVCVLLFTGLACWALCALRGARRPRETVAAAATAACTAGPEEEEFASAEEEEEEYASAEEEEEEEYASAEEEEEEYASAEEEEEYASAEEEEEEEEYTSAEEEEEEEGEYASAEEEEKVEFASAEEEVEEEEEKKEEEEKIEFASPLKEKRKPEDATEVDTKLHEGATCTEKVANVTAVLEGEDPRPYEDPQDDKVEDCQEEMPDSLSDASHLPRPAQQNEDVAAKTWAEEVDDAFPIPEECLQHCGPDEWSLVADHKKNRGKHKVATGQQDDTQTRCRHSGTQAPPSDTQGRPSGTQSLPARTQFQGSKSQVRPSGARRRHRKRASGTPFTRCWAALVKAPRPEAAGGTPSPPHTQARPSGTQTRPARQARPACSKALPSGTQNRPACGQARPACGQALPSGTKARPACGKARPTCGKALPSGTRARPANGQGLPPETRTRPSGTRRRHRKSGSGTLARVCPRVQTYTAAPQPVPLTRCWAAVVKAPRPEAAVTPCPPNTMGHSSGTQSRPSGNQARPSGNQARHPDNQARHPANQARHSGNQDRHSGNQAFSSGNQARHSGNQARYSGYQARHSGNQAHSSGNQARHSGNQAHSSGNQAHHSVQGPAHG
ncbi:protein SPT2 homolog [Eriocheir sinensis]|uniref:protein SPT2 homolog n=1 Tax=Eriocheir sinensis TaxID=95602 RepID=UPI0021C5FB3C|nr:protein SPT2 homolog [Eriocheir sinensis]